MTQRQRQQPVAIVGMAGRFPDAPTLEAFWQNLAGGHESIVDFTDDQLRAAGVPDAALADPAYVKRGTVLEGTDLFDASFFGYSPREAEALDPQQRLFLETAWHALEDAGYLGEAAAPRVGVFASISLNQYLFSNVLANRAFMEAVGQYQLMLASDKDFVATRIAYKLNLHGPSVTVQTACSSSLVAVHMAVQSLLNGECDIAVAGGATVAVPQQAGYLHAEGMILSKDGHCRPFDADSSGTRGGSGVGVVVLRRAEDATRDRDRIRAVILGAAINNDGARKVGYTAPSVEGQADAIAAAQAAGGVEPGTIAYIEAHGTGTRLGDPIEVAALNRVFGDRAARQSVALGSVKSNIGHLDAAAGIAGLIKASLAIEHRQIPPSLNFSAPNPQIDFSSTAFYVNDRLRDWTDASPRRAGVSSFGIGGTNAHVVLEEAPQPIPTVSHRTEHVLTVSAKSSSALAQAARDLADALVARTDGTLGDVAYTLHVGRRRFPFRLSVVAGSMAEAATTLKDRAGKPVVGDSDQDHAEVAFLFSGQGTQYEGMAAGLLDREPDFAEPFEECRAILLRVLGQDIRTLIGSERTDNRADSPLTQTALAQPVLFAIEYALARMWMRWGVAPAAMMGHSLGEYVAACVAGVFSLEDALRLVVERARLMQSMSPGAMLSVPLAADVVAGLGAPVDIAAINTPQSCAVSGTPEDISALERTLRGRAIDCKRLATSHAFHSRMMDGVLAPLRAVLASMTLNPPRIPIVSNLTGTWIRPEEATSPDYWVSHLRSTVRFADGLAVLTAGTPRVLLEIGPGEALCGLARQSVKRATLDIVASLPHRLDPRGDAFMVQQTLGALWESGVEIGWDRVHAHDTPGRVPLPGYPFERRSYWVAPQRQDAAPQPAAKRGSLDDWFYAPSWMRSPAPGGRAAAAEAGSRTWVVFTADTPLSDTILNQLAAHGDRVLTVACGSTLGRDGDRFEIDPRNRRHHDAVVAAAIENGARDIDILHLWNTAGGDECVTEACAFYSPLYLGQALAEARSRVTATMIFASSGMHAVLGGDSVQPMKSLLLGPARVIPLELPQFRTLSVDVPHQQTAADTDTLAKWLIAERDDQRTARVVAYRQGLRWEQTWAPFHTAPNAAPPLRDQGVYLITGGLGGVALAIARDFASGDRARLALTTRRTFPARAEWNAILGRESTSDIATQISAILELEALGAEVLVLTADASDPRSVQSAIAETRQRFGALHGIVHAAGVNDDGLLLLKSAEGTARVLGPKVAGALALTPVIAEGTLDFVVLFSSINAVMGFVGAIDYTAANAFLDAFAAHHANGPTRVVSINWDTWGDVGMAVKTAVPAAMEAQRRQRLANGLRTHEGIDALKRIIASGLPQVAVVTKDLTGLLAAASRSERDALNRARAEVFSAALVPADETAIALPTEADAGMTATETLVASIWRELLGVPRVSADDDFFALGGHSLMATAVLSRVKNARGVDLTLRAVFEAPTLGQFAAIVDDASGSVPVRVHADAGGDDDREEVEF
jgi:acyl transferase domain-containing protein